MKACPFCGGENLVYRSSPARWKFVLSRGDKVIMRDHWFECGTCRATGPKYTDEYPHDKYKSKEATMGFWNKRKECPPNENP